MNDTGKLCITVQLYSWVNLYAALLNKLQLSAYMHLSIYSTTDPAIPPLVHSDEAGILLIVHLPLLCRKLDP